MDEVHQKLLAEQSLQAQGREKFWNERDREEKLEALRFQTIQLFQMVQSTLDNVQALMRHQHAQSGELMTPMDGRNAAPGQIRWIPTSLEDRPETGEPSAANRAIGGMYGR